MSFALLISSIATAVNAQDIIKCVQNIGRQRKPKPTKKEYPLVCAHVVRPKQHGVELAVKSISISTLLKPGLDGKRNTPINWREPVPDPDPLVLARGDQDLESACPYCGFDPWRPQALHFRAG